MQILKIKMIAQWEMIIKIKNNQPKMEIKWFGWQPDSNPQQRSKIEEYLKMTKVNSFLMK